MTPVVHLAQPQWDFQTRRAIAALSGGADARVRFVGRAIVVPDPLRGPDTFQPQVVHAWGMRALVAAALRSRRRVVFSPTEFPSTRTVRWLRAVMGYRHVEVVCSTATQRRTLVEKGIPLDRCHLIRPGVDFSRVRRRRDTELRKRLGFTDDDHVVFAPGESTRAAAHEDAAWAAAIAHFLDPRVKLLIWGRGDRAAAVVRRSHRIGGENLLHVAEARLRESVPDMETLLPAVDAVLITARGAVPTLPIAVCMAAGLPIVSTVTYTVAELLEDHHTALMVPRRDPRLLARRLLELRDDAGLQWSISDMARTEAYEYFSQSRFLDQYRTLYRQVAACERVDVPEPQPGAGRRFHARV